MRIAARDAGEAADLAIAHAGIVKAIADSDMKCVDRAGVDYRASIVSISIGESAVGDKAQRCKNITSPSIHKSSSANLSDSRLAIPCTNIVPLRYLEFGSYPKSSRSGPASANGSKTAPIVCDYRCETRT
jgi:hypothetical protein